MKKLLVCLVVLVAAGCAGPGFDSEANKSLAFEVKVPDGRMVTCISFNSGLSCDWSK